MESGAEEEVVETLSQKAMRIKAEVLEASYDSISPEEVHRLADLVRELHRIEALMEA